MVTHAQVDAYGQAYSNLLQGLHLLLHVLCVCKLLLVSAGLLVHLS